MPYREFFWTVRALQKIEDNGLTVADVEHAVLCSSGPAEVSRSSGRLTYSGPTISGETVFVVFEELDAVQIMVITAFRK